MTQRVKNEKKRYDKTPTAKNAAPASNDNMLWMLGFVMLVFGIFAVCSVLSHFVHWASDLTALRNDETLSGVEIPFENLCSSAGATVAYWVVDCTFGVFGIIIPVVITVVGWRIFRRKRLRLNHFALSAALVLVMGALTMGFIGTHVGAAYDIGGSLGQACATDLEALAGAFGTVLILLAGWILTGVFINRNFIRTVNRASDKMVSQSERLVSVVKERVIKNHHTDDSDEEADEEQIGDVEPDGIAEPSPAVQPVPAATEIKRDSQPMPSVEPRVEPSPVVRADADERPTYTPTQLVGDEPDEEERYTEDVQEDAPMGENNADKDSDGGVELKRMGLPEPDEDGFIVIPNGGAVPNKIDVDALLAPEKPHESAPSTDEDGFTVIPRSTDDAATHDDGGHVAAEEKSDMTSHVVDATAETGEHPADTVGEDAARSSEAETAEEQGGIVVKVHENPVRQVGEEDMEQNLYDPLRDLEHYRKPYASLLEDYQSPQKVSDAEIYDNKCRIEETLKYFGIPIVDIHATVGPTVTLYEIVQAQGVKISKIQGLEKDIAQSLKSLGIRIIAPIPGRGTIGIEVPNRDKQIVSMYSAICSEEFQRSKAELPVVIGRTIQNENYTFDLAKMPHLLVAGATGQGKSVGLNAIITSLLYRKHPAQLKFVMIDPKMVEFSVYNRLERHFLAKMESDDEAIVTDPKKAVCVLNSLVEEMGRRLELCKMATARNIVEYNEKFVARRLNPQKGYRYLPYIVVIVDEFADLIATSGREIELPISRIAAKARAVGIHMILATQRPDTKVITGTIKGNFPSRIAFKVASMIDSRTILDAPGANRLIGRGDMLISVAGSDTVRVQCAFVDTPEVENIVEYISKQVAYPTAYLLPEYIAEGSEGGGNGGPVDLSNRDPFFDEAARLIVIQQQGSTSLIQRKFAIGYNRAGRLMDQLEAAGVVGPSEGSKARQVLIPDEYTLEQLLNSLK